WGRWALGSGRWPENAHASVRLTVRCPPSAVHLCGLGAWVGARDCARLCLAPAISAPSAFLAIAFHERDRARLSDAVGNRFFDAEPESNQNIARLIVSL